MSNAALFAARFLIGFLLIGGAFQKWGSPAGAGDMLTGLGLPFVLVWPALLYNAVAGAALWLGVYTRPIAVSAAAYCAVTSFFHLHLAITANDPWQMTIFVKNWSVAGGCLALAVAGSGRWALRPDPR